MSMTEFLNPARDRQYGDMVIDEYNKYVAEPSKLNVVDIAPSSIVSSLHNKFADALKKEPRVSKFYLPPEDPAFHIEIPQDVEP